MERLQDIGQILALCVQMTNLKLEDSCGFDRQFAAQWYENEYLTGKHTRYVMKPDLSITSYADGKVYRAFNCDDAKAVELMEANPEYKDYFIDLDAPEAAEPEVTEPKEIAEAEAAEPTPEEIAEAEAAEPTPEEIAEAEAAAKRSEAAKKAAATRAAKKAAAEAAAADISEFE